ncbi:MAG: hypothetical protein ABIL58_15930 [Pseudomonadota bacterium]
MKLDIIEMSQMEHNSVVGSAAKYGTSFVNAHDIVAFSWVCLKSVRPDAFAFILFLSQFQKSITLSLLSALRNHEVQFNLMLRQALEAGALASYALHSPDVEGFARTDAHDCLFTDRKVAKKAYKWLESEYPTHSKSMKYMKDQINESYAHASILPASDNIQFDFHKIGSTFFDKPDELITIQHLWWIGNVVIGILDLFEHITMRYPKVTLVPDFRKKMQRFGRDNTRIKIELQTNPRFARWIQLT